MGADGLVPMRRDAYAVLAGAVLMVVGAALLDIRAGLVVAGLLLVVSTLPLPGAHR